MKKKHLILKINIQYVGHCRGGLPCSSLGCMMDRTKSLSLTENEMNILPALHCGFDVCIGRICHRQENISGCRPVFFQSASLSVCIFSFSHPLSLNEGKHTESSNSSSMQLSSTVHASPCGSASSFDCYLLLPIYCFSYLSVLALIHFIVSYF